MGNYLFSFHRQGAPSPTSQLCLGLPLPPLITLKTHGTLSPRKSQTPGRASAEGTCLSPAPGANSGNAGRTAWRAQARPASSARSRPLGGGRPVSGYSKAGSHGTNVCRRAPGGHPCCSDWTVSSPQPRGPWGEPGRTGEPTALRSPARGRRSPGTDRSTCPHSPGSRSPGRARAQRPANSPPPHTGPRPRRVTAPQQLRAQTPSHQTQPHPVLPQRNTVWPLPEDGVQPQGAPEPIDGFSFS